MSRRFTLIGGLLIIIASVCYAFVLLNSHDSTLIVYNPETEPYPPSAVPWISQWSNPDVREISSRGDLYTASSVSVDGENNSYVAGYYDATDYNLELEAQPELYLHKFDNQGSLIWTKVLQNRICRIPHLLMENDQIILAGTSVVITGSQKPGGVGFFENSVIHIDKNGHTLNTLSFDKETDLVNGIEDIGGLTEIGENRYAVFGETFQGSEALKSPTHLSVSLIGSGESNPIKREFLNGTGDQFPEAIVKDGNDNVYISFSFSNLIDVGNGIPPLLASNQGGNITFAVCKYSPELDLQWVKMLPILWGSMCLNSKGQLVMVGKLNAGSNSSIEFPSTLLPGDSIMVLLDTDGALLSSIKCAIPFKEYSFVKMAALGDDSVVIAANIFGFTEPVEGSYGPRAFLVQCDKDGVVKWTESCLSQDSVFFSDFALGPDESIRLCGVFDESAHFEGDLGILDVGTEGIRNAFLAKFQMPSK
jgi:hypothetical protein